ncbi:MAG: DUF1015 domain-containing protein [Lachnospiraceae bacterium]
MNCLHVPEILLPKEGTDLSKWAVIACDQYTSQKEYWDETKEIVSDSPSTLHLILPEVYLGSSNEDGMVKEIHQTMKAYVDEEVLTSIGKGFVLVERGINKTYARNGLVVAIDLETYEYKKGEHSLIRPTEMTVEERIPPRLRVRQNATLELPHIMLLIDDPEQSVIEPLMQKKDSYQKVYDTDLMQNGGHISGWFIKEGKETEKIMNQIEALADDGVFRTKYGLTEEYPVLNLAVGDGNHSMATAKAAWENIKKDLTEEERINHPARFCLCEIVNIHDASLEVEPIHRVLFQVDEADLLENAGEYFTAMGSGFEVKEIEAYEKPVATANQHSFVFCSDNGWKLVSVINPKFGIAVAGIQTFLDKYLESRPESKIDYIHGIDVVTNLGTKENNVGIILPDVSKEDLFIGVIKDGVLPRKTFSMGEANEKRYYMECKKIH